MDVVAVGVDEMSGKPSSSAGESNGVSMGSNNKSSSSSASASASAGGDNDNNEEEDAEEEEAEAEGEPKELQVPGAMGHRQWAMDYHL